MAKRRSANLPFNLNLRKTAMSNKQDDRKNHNKPGFVSAALALAGSIVIYQGAIILLGPIIGGKHGDYGTGIFLMFVWLICFAIAAGIIATITSKIKQLFKKAD